MWLLVREAEAAISFARHTSILTMVAVETDLIWRVCESQDKGREGIQCQRCKMVGAVLCTKHITYINISSDLMFFLPNQKCASKYYITQHNTADHDII